NIAARPKTRHAKAGGRFVMLTPSRPNMLAALCAFRELAYSPTHPLFGAYYLEAACTREEGMSSKKRTQRNSELNRRNILLGGTTLAAAAIASTGSEQIAQAQQRSAQAPTAPAGQRPNILVIFGDDIGQTNLSAYSFGLMGYRTPNIDRIAKEGMMFTD